MAYMTKYTGPCGPMGPQGEPGITLKEVDALKEYMEMIMKILGYDLPFDKFMHLSPEEKLVILRDIRITNVIKPLWEYPELKEE